MSVCRRFLDISKKPSLIEQCGRATLETCLVSVLLSVSMVMAGTGDLGVLRICRMLRARVGSQHAHALYGSHMAVSMSVGMLFMGGGR